MSPLQYQKQIRLQEARRQLLAKPRGVTSVAFAVGYESVSQFNREYSRQYGLSPGQDANRFKLTQKADVAGDVAKVVTSSDARGQR